MGIVEAMNSPQGKKIVGIAYSAGASVVIIGALFKIMHWPGAGIMLTAGMLTEAILFAIGIFDKPHKEYHWELVWPELDSEEEHDAPAAKGLKDDSKELSIPKVDVANLVEEELAKLSSGIQKLGETAGHLGSLSSAASVSESYISNVSKASEAAGAFATSQKNLKDSSDSLVSSYQDIAKSIGSASEGSKNFASQIDGINKNISTISSVFELQVKSVNEQNEAMKTLAAAVNKIEASLNGSAQSAESYKQEISNLAKQMHDLNTVYGNMLNAMTIRG